MNADRRQIMGVEHDVLASWYTYISAFGSRETIHGAQRGCGWMWTRTTSAFLMFWFITGIHINQSYFNHAMVYFFSCNPQWVKQSTASSLSPRKNSRPWGMLLYSIVFRWGRLMLAVEGGWRSKQKSYYYLQGWLSISLFSLPWVWLHRSAFDNVPQRRKSEKEAGFNHQPLRPVSDLINWIFSWSNTPIHSYSHSILISLRCRPHSHSHPHLYYRCHCQCVSLLFLCWVVIVAVRFDVLSPWL